MGAVSRLCDTFPFRMVERKASVFAGARLFRKGDFVTLNEMLEDARKMAFDAPVVVRVGEEYRLTTSSERKLAKAGIVERAEAYARWRFKAHKEGLVVRQW